MEVVAVLAHELGHWANWDTTRQLLIAEVLHFTNYIDNRSTCFLSSLRSRRLSRMEVYIVHSDLQINPL
jgi:Zn-dependent protease with chaperone function